jgi:membrane associated rhomboid family serine protease
MYQTAEARQIRGEKSVRKLDNHLLVTLRGPCLNYKLQRLTTCASLVYRLNTFPLMHLNVLHVIFNVLALTPLLERFESEFGTLVTLALFTGRKHVEKG